MINKNNLQAIKTLADKIEYTVTKTEKEARISPCYDSFAWDSYKQEINELYGEVQKDIVAIYNHNTRDYSNIFAGRNKQVQEAIDLNRIKGLTKKEKALIDCVVVDDNVTASSYDNENYLYIDWIETPTSDKQEKIEKKIKDSLIVESVTARGYSQGDWEKYTFVYYKDVTKDTQQAINCIMEDIKNMFTVQEYYITKVHIETRLYTSGIEETEEVDQDSYGTVSYDGYTDDIEKELAKEGYKVIIKN